MRQLSQAGSRANASAGARAFAVILAAAAIAPAVAPAPLMAQPGGVASACNIDPNSPKELALVSLKFGQARAATDPAQRKAALMQVMKELETKPERFAKNPAGYNYTLSQALAAWAVEPGIGFTPTRGAIGLANNPTATYDIVASMDTAFKAIETAAPACAADVVQLRQNDVWLALTRKALDASNSQQLDSADYYAMRSLVLSNVSPYPHYVMGNVANARGDKKAAVGHWKQVVQVAGTDTSYRELKHSSTYYIGMTQLEEAAKLSGAEKQAAAREAASNLKVLLEGSETGDTPNIMNAMADALTLAGDSAQLNTVYAPMLATPDKYNDFSLTMGGVLATRGNKTDDALKLFDAAVKKNPTSRDALRNLAATYYAKENFKAMFDPTAKLVAIDPNNFDGWMMYAYASQGIAQATKVPAEKKMWTDSLVKYRTLAEALPAKVEVTQFQRATGNATLLLTLEQQAAAAGTYSVTAEFLNDAGAVVATDTQSVGPIAKGKTAQVTLKGTGAGITGYRYKPIK